MLFDINTIFSGVIAANGARAGQSITGTTLSTNVVDLRNSPTGLALKDEGLVGPDAWLIVQVLLAFNNLTSLTITVESDSASDLSAAPIVHLSKTVPLAGLAAGAMPLRVQLPSDDYKRYLALRYTVAGTAPTTGSLWASFSPTAPQRNIAYPSAVALDV